LVLNVSASAISSVAAAATIQSTPCSKSDWAVVTTGTPGCQVRLDEEGFSAEVLAELLNVTPAPADPGIFAGVILLLVVIATLATFIPALRAVNVDPLVALKQE